jgi:glycosyltransferase involved in cell wall biosynthesis
LVKLSVVIPSWKDPLLHKTIESLLENTGLGDQIEIIPVIDGYELMQPLSTDPRVKPVFQENTGMRGAINSGVRAAKGEFIARFDEHCMVAKDWDKTVIEGPFEDNWIMTLNRHELNPETWTVMSQEPKRFSKLIICEDLAKTKFAGVTWHTRNKEMKDVPIAETMAMQGSMWIMKKSWWEKVIGELQSEGYGNLYQDSVEMTMKTWQAGGKLMLNQKTRYSHKHRTFRRTHNINGVDSQRSFDYAIKVWGDYYRDVIVPRFGI